MGEEKNRKCLITVLMVYMRFPNANDAKVGSEVLGSWHNIKDMNKLILLFPYFKRMLVIIIDYQCNVYLHN